MTKFPCGVLELRSRGFFGVVFQAGKGHGEAGVERSQEAKNGGPRLNFLF